MMGSLVGCESLGENLGYYSQAVRGHSQIIFNQQHIDQLIADAKTDDLLRKQLRLSQEVLRFARDSLGLPNNKSYSKYVDTGRDFVVWNVVATPNYSIEPIEHCFPIAGCVSYRGYYKLDDAQAYARKLKAQAYDVSIGRVAAYSTLGWFNDPLLNTMLQGGDIDLAATLIHEITHQQTYVKGDTAFNESFATAVEEMGLKQWLMDKGKEAQWQHHKENKLARETVVDLILQHRNKIGKAYEGTNQSTDEALQKLKTRLFNELKTDYKLLREHLNYAVFDHWFAGEINNASLVLFADYNRWVSAFKQLRSQSASWKAFYKQVQQLTVFDQTDRDEMLKELNRKWVISDATLKTL